MSYLIVSLKRFAWPYGFINGESAGAETAGPILVGLDRERGSSVVECRTRNQVSPGSNHPFLPFRSLGIKRALSAVQRTGYCAI